MSFRTLGEFVTACDAKGDVKRITREVDWKCEVTEIACREAKAQGPILVFENVRGARFPLAVNVLAASRRIEWALGRTPRAVGAEIEEIFHALPPRELSDVWGIRSHFGRMLASRPSITNSASAGTHWSIVRARVNRVGLPRRNPANANSSIPSGSGATADNSVAGSAPTATATSSPSPRDSARW